MTGMGKSLPPRIGAPDTPAREAPRPAPLVVPAIALMLGIWLSESVGATPGGWRAAASTLPAVLLVPVLLILRRPATRQVYLTGLIAAIGLAVGFSRHQSTTARPAHHIVHALADEPVLTRLAGRIVTSPIERPPLKLNPFLPFDPAPRTQFVLAAEEVRTTDPPHPTTGNVRVSVEAGGLNLRLGERVQLTGRIFRPTGPQNPGQTDWRRWYRHQGIDGGMVIEEAAHVVPLPGPASFWHRLVSAARGTARSLLFEPYADFQAEESVRLLDVMVLGQRSVADQKLNEAFLRAGGMHFLAVSGFHVGVLAGAAWWLVRRGLGRGRRSAAIAMLAVSVLYALVAEPNAPILRAVIMVALAAFALMTRRPFCAINWLALSAACILMWNPQHLFRASFQFSFIETLALVTIVPRCYRRLFGHRAQQTPPPPEPQAFLGVLFQKLGRWLAALSVICVCAWATSVPLKLLSFGYVAPWGWLGTFLLSPVITFTIVLSFTTVLCNAVFPPLAGPVGFLLRWSTDGLLWLVRVFAGLPGTMIRTPRPPGGLVVLTYLGALVVAARWRGRKPGTGSGGRGLASRRRVSVTTILRASLAVLGALSWLGWLVLPGPQRQAGYSVHVLAVGNGSATVISAPDGRGIVFDVGTDTNSDAGQTVLAALPALGVKRIEAAMISHGNFDHYSGLPTLMTRMAVPRWMTNLYFARQQGSEARLGRLREQLPPTVTAPAGLRAGDTLALGDARIEVLWPPEGLDQTWQTNDTSLVVRLTAQGRSVLLTGDIEREAMLALLAAERAGQISLKADVLVAPHHGAVLPEVTADFYAAVSPRVVIVSTRTPRPKAEVLVQDVLGPAARMVLTGQAGTVTVRITPAGELRIETPYAGGAGN
jgi:competence protein ComEC